MGFVQNREKMAHIYVPLFSLEKCETKTISNELSLIYLYSHPDSTGNEEKKASGLGRVSSIGLLFAKAIHLIRQMHLCA